MTSPLPELSDRLRAVSKNLQTLFYQGPVYGGPYFQGDEVPSLVFLWRGKAYPKVGDRFKHSFNQLQLAEKWVVEVGEKDNTGIRVLPVCLHATEKLQYEQRLRALEGLRDDNLFLKNTITDFGIIVEWLQGFNDAPQ